MQESEALELRFLTLCATCITHQYSLIFTGERQFVNTDLVRYLRGNRSDNSRLLLGQYQPYPANVGLTPAKKQPAVATTFASVVSDKGLCHTVLMPCPHATSKAMLGLSVLILLL